LTFSKVSMKRVGVSRCGENQSPVDAKAPTIPAITIPIAAHRISHIDSGQRIYTACCRAVHA
jgi:hypothetical protein